MFHWRNQCEQGLPAPADWGLQAAQARAINRLKDFRADDTGDEKRGHHYFAAVTAHCTTSLVELVVKRRRATRAFEMVVCERDGRSEGI